MWRVEDTKTPRVLPSAAPILRLPEVSLDHAAKQKGREMQPPWLGLPDALPPPSASYTLTDAGPPWALSLDSR